MKLLHALAVVAVSVSLAACATKTTTADKASKQTEVRQATHTSLDKFYKAKPQLQADVANAPGYAVFTTYGLSFIVGGAGGKGVAHNNRTNTDTFMSMGQASAGLQAGAAESETLIVFKTPEAFQKFLDEGWQVGGGAAAQAGAKGDSVGAAGGEAVIADADYYTLTKNGLQAGVAVAGTKFWKDKELN